MQTEQLYIRKTHKFADGWASEDDWNYAGPIRLTAPKQVAEGNGHDDGGVYVQYARIPAGVDWRLVAQCLRDTLNVSSCRHEYDCCGCRSQFVSIQLHKPRVLRVRTSVSYNY